jgi:sRNA-binding protein
MTKRPLLKLKTVISPKKDISNKEKPINISPENVKEYRQKKYETILRFLQKRYPKCFTKKPKLLAINIHKELFILLSEKFSKTAIQQFLYVYCTKSKYRKALLNKKSRVNLDGTPYVITF